MTQAEITALLALFADVDTAFDEHPGAFKSDAARDAVLGRCYRARNTCRAVMEAETVVYGRGK